MNNEQPANEDAGQNPIDRHELERDLLDWFQTQDYNQDEIDLVLQRIRDFDARMLHESFFASVGTGSIEFGEIIDSLLTEHSDKPAELEQLINQWPKLNSATRRAIGVLANQRLSTEAHQAVVILIESLPKNH